VKRARIAAVAAAALLLNLLGASPGAGAPPKKCFGEVATIVDGPGNSYREGTGGKDVFFGGGGDDIFFGKGGPDRLCGGAGDDSLHGDDGADKINAGKGNDDLFAGNGVDTLIGGAGTDSCYLLTQGDSTTGCEN
jgi:Ca2+-binding RTX toxin-like protein